MTDRESDEKAWKDKADLHAEQLEMTQEALQAARDEADGKVAEFDREMSAMVRRSQIGHPIAPIDGW